MSTAVPVNTETPVRRPFPGEKKPVALHPEPEVVSRPAVEGEVPRGAKTVEQLAKRHGWTVRATYSRGTKPGRGRAVVDALALRLRRDDTAAWAVWLNSKFDTAQVLRPGDIARSVTATGLRAELTRGDAA